VQLSDSDLQLARQQLAFAQRLRQHDRLYPSERYEPHAWTERGPRAGRQSGQAQFHEAERPIRVMAPGNGWGGTTALGAEVDAWARGTQRWRPTPPPPVRMVWFCPEFRQFDIVRWNLEQFCIGYTPRFVTGGFGGPRYIWPNGSTLYLCSYDRSWTHIQGIELDLAAFDEQPPIMLWREMMQRRRGIRKCEYICKATQTKGYSWMATELYEPWKEHHQQRGVMDEERMVLEQLHPDMWVWPFGGCHDNPALDAQDIEWYETRRWSSAKERKVRLFGGFESWTGDAVFDQDALDWMRAMQGRWDEEFGAGRSGMLVA